MCRSSEKRGVVLYHSSLYSLEIRLFTELGLDISVTLASQWASSSEVTGMHNHAGLFYVDIGDLNLGPSACISSTLIYWFISSELNWMLDHLNWSLNFYLIDKIFSFYQRILIKFSSLKFLTLQTFPLPTLLLFMCYFIGLHLSGYRLFS